MESIDGTIIHHHNTANQPHTHKHNNNNDGKKPRQYFPFRMKFITLFLYKCQYK